jgi:hypothetical protein
MHFFLALSISYETGKLAVIIIFCANIQQNSLVRRVCKHNFPEIHEVSLRTLTERHVITFWKQLINLLYQPAWVILVKLG